MACACGIGPARISFRVVMRIRFPGDAALVASLVCMLLATTLLSACGGGSGDGAPSSTTTTPIGAGDDPSVPDPAAPVVAAPAFDLSHWRLTIPADAGSGSGGKALDILPSALVGPPAYSSPWFYLEPDGALSFWVPVDGAIGGSSPNPRSELREMLDPNSARANWSAAQDSEMNARCKVMAVPSANPQVIVGQIHAYTAAHPLVMLQYHYDADAGSGELVAHVNSTPGAASRLTFPLIEGLPLNAPFRYQLAVHQGVLTMTANDKSAQYSLGSQWRAASLYFKAGAYIKAGGTGGGLVSFYELQTSHH